VGGKLNKTQLETAVFAVGAATLRTASKRVAFDPGPFAPLCENNMTSFTKPEVHNILRCCQRMTKPRPKVTCTTSWWNLYARFWDMRTDRQTDRHVDLRTLHPSVREVTNICRKSSDEIFYAVDFYGLLRLQTVICWCFLSSCRISSCFDDVCLCSWSNWRRMSTFYTAPHRCMHSMCTERPCLSHAHTYDITTTTDSYELWYDVSSFYAHTTVSATEVSLLLVLVCGTPCRHICGKLQTFLKNH